MDKTVQRIPFLRLTAALATGVIAGSVIQLNSPLLLGVLLALTGFLAWLNLNYNYRISTLFGIVGHLSIAVAGILAFNIYNQKPVFYANGKFSAAVLEIVQEKPNSWQSVLKINTFYRNDSVFNTSEKVMVYFAKSEKAEKLKPGEIVLFQQTPQMVANANNPYEFDYQSYLARKKIYRQVYLPEHSWVKAEGNSLVTAGILAERVRMRLLEIYRNQDFGEKELHVLSALTLGYKRGLDPETKRVFASAGAMHVLAVSGLHVGIVYFIFATLLAFLNKQKYGRIAFIIIVVLALWSFAFITGLSPSVMRAATMFTFVTVGKGIGRQAAIYNSLAASAFFLLLVNPNNLFEAGFQLSYSAVFGIVFLQPKLQKIFTFKYKVVNYFYVLLTVSVAAQIATFPVSVFYFNQFPVYFWISNLLVIPAVTFLIPAGIILLLFSWIKILSGAAALAIGYVLRFVIGFLGGIEKLPHSVIGLSFSWVQLFLVLVLLLFVFLFVETAHKRHFKLALLAFLFLPATSLVQKTADLRRREIIVYNYPDQTVIQLVKGRRSYVVSETALPETGTAAGIIENTVRKMRLNPPVFLEKEESFYDSILYLKNGLLFFEGRLIALENFPLKSTQFPVLVIGPYSQKQGSENEHPGLQVVSTRRYRDNSATKDDSVFYLRYEGAFREKW